MFNLQFAASSQLDSDKHATICYLKGLDEQQARMCFKELCTIAYPIVAEVKEYAYLANANCTVAMLDSMELFKLNKAVQSICYEQAWPLQVDFKCFMPHVTLAEWQLADIHMLPCGVVYQLARIQLTYKCKVLAEKDLISDMAMATMYSEHSPAKPSTGAGRFAKQGLRQSYIANRAKYGELLKRG